MTCTGQRTERRTRLPGACDDLSCLRRVHTLCGACRRRSPPRRPPDTRCHRRACVQRRKPLPAGGPTKILVPTTPREERRLPEDRDAFHRHDTRRSCFAKGSLPPAFAPALSLTPPTLFPQVGESALIGHCKVTVRSPAGSVTGSRVQTPLGLAGTAAPGTDDPSTPPSSTDSAVDGDRLPRSHRCRSQRLDGFYDREPAARCAANFMSGLCRSAMSLATELIAAQSLFYPQVLSTASTRTNMREITASLDFRPRIVRRKASNAQVVDNNVV